jgi:hypothetical protein
MFDSRRATYTRQSTCCNDSTKAIYFRYSDRGCGFSEKLGLVPASSVGLDDTSVQSEVTQGSRRNTTFTRKANATFVFLWRNSNLSGILTSMQQLEDRFNRQHN